MTCSNCPSAAEGFAVIPGIGETGEVRFYCDPCARNHRVKMRYWDGRDLDVGGYRENPDLGPSFHTLIFSFHDVSRMRPEDLEPVMDWVEDEELAVALRGAETVVAEKVYAALPLPRVRRIRVLLEDGAPEGKDVEAEAKSARERIVSVIKRL